MKTSGLSLRTKLAITVLVAAATLLGALALLWATGTRNNEALVAKSSEAILDNSLASLRSRGEITLGHLAEVLPNLVYYYDFVSLNDALSPVLAQADVEYIQVYDLEGRLIHDGKRVVERFGERMDDPQADEVIAAIDQSNKPLVLWSDRQVDVSRPLMLGSKPLGGIRIGLSRASADQAVMSKQAELQAQLRNSFKTQVRWLFGTFALLLLGAAVAGWLIARGLLRPIRELAAAADQLERGQFAEIEINVDRGDELGQLVQSFNRMAASLREHDREIRRLAYQDALTDLPNRLMFRKLLDQAIDDQEQRPTTGLGLLFVDLDDFKPINDTYGHDVGDRALTEFAQCLRRQVSAFAGKSGTERPIVARLGGDEFVALLSGKDIRDRCNRLANTILAGLEQPFEVDGHQFFLSVSIGVSRFPEDARSARQLLKCGDLAMYQAKLRGKYRLCFYHDLPEKHKGT